MSESRLPSSPQSYWTATTAKTEYPALEQDIAVDVAVIGGGLTGISTAWMLKHEGLKVVVLEADRICQGTTAHSTAKITAQHNLIYDYLISRFGRELADQYARANEKAIVTIADTVREYKIDCDFQWRPAFVYTMQDKYVKKIEREARAAADLGIKATYLESLDLPFPVKAAVCFDGQAQFHPRKYVLALAEKIPGAGCEIYEQSRATDVQQAGKNNITVLTKTGKTVTADWVVLATHFPFYDNLGLYFARMYPDRSYVLAMKTKERLAEGMYVTAESPGRSLRTQEEKNDQLLLVAGEHHKTAHGDNLQEHYSILREFAEAHFTVEDIPYRWSTQDYTTIDKIPYIGPTRRNSSIFVATGFRKWGISTSTVAAMLIKDLVTQGESPWQDIYSPQRGTKLGAAGQLAVQNADVARQLIAGKLQSPSAADNVKTGEGKIIELDGQKMGAYRDEKGELHLVDSTCTHMGCELKWNSGEKTWDCPCHGSRFTYEGDIVEGPAVYPLHHPSQGKNPVEPHVTRSTPSQPPQIE